MSSINEKPRVTNTVKQKNRSRKSTNDLDKQEVGVIKSLFINTYRTNVSAWRKKSIYNEKVMMPWVHETIQFSNEKIVKIVKMWKCECNGEIETDFKMNMGSHHNLAYNPVDETNLIMNFEIKLRLVR